MQLKMMKKLSNLAYKIISSTETHHHKSWSKHSINIFSISHFMGLTVSRFLSTAVAPNDYYQQPRETNSVMGFSENMRVSQYSQNPCLDPSKDELDVEKVFRIINKNASSEPSLGPALRNCGAVFTPTLVEKVLKRARFSNSNGYKALEFFSYVGREPGYSHTSEAYNQMLYIMGRMRRFDKSWDLLGEMERNDPGLITHKTMQIVLARIAKVCSLRETLEAFEMLKEYIGVLDTVCFNALLRSLCEERNMKDAGIVYHQLKRRFKPNVQTFNILLSGWQSAEEALSFYDEMLQLGRKPDIVTYNSLLEVLCKDKDALCNDRMKKVFKIVEEMKDNECYPDLMTYTILIGGMGLIGWPDRAWNLLAEMREHGYYPDAAAYNAVIKNFCMAGRVQYAYKVFDEMVSKGLDPNPNTYINFVRYYSRSENWEGGWDVYARMINTRCFPNTRICILLMRLLCRHEILDRALKLWEDMLEMGFGSYPLVLDVLMDGLCDNGKLNEAEKSFLETIEKGHKPSFFSYKRLRVLLEVAQKHDSIHALSEKMRSIEYR